MGEVLQQPGHESRDHQDDSRYYSDDNFARVNHSAQYTYVRMKLPWFRNRFLLRRRLDRVFLDGPDALIRLMQQSHWPPYSLRAFVGGAHGFDEVGEWFCGELLRLGLLNRGSRVLDIGCGCGRVAYRLATDARLRDLEIRYTGMDIDRACVEWCRQHVTAINPRFCFYHADCANPSYNPGGLETAERYVFPHAESSFDLILLTSVFTHLLEDAAVHYLSEVSRLLAPGGCAYASFFLLNGGDRHGIQFPFARGRSAVNREDYPANAVAYDEGFIRESARAAGLSVAEPVYYGKQDIVVFRSTP